MENKQVEKQAYSAFVLYYLAIHGYSLKDIIEQGRLEDGEVKGISYPSFDDFLADEYRHDPFLMKHLIGHVIEIEDYLRDVTQCDDEPIGIVAIDFAAACFKEIPLEEYKWVLDGDAMTSLLRDASLELENDISKFMFIIEHDYAYDKSDALLAAEHVKRDYENMVDNVKTKE